MTPAKIVLAKLKRPLVCLRVTLPPLITARIIWLLCTYVKFRCTMWDPVKTIKSRSAWEPLWLHLTEWWLLCQGMGVLTGYRRLQQVATCPPPNRSAFLHGDLNAHLIHSSVAPKRYLNRISRFCTAQPCAQRRHTNVDNATCNGAEKCHIYAFWNVLGSTQMRHIHIQTEAQHLPNHVISHDQNSCTDGLILKKLTRQTFTRTDFIAAQLRAPKPMT